MRYFEQLSDCTVMDGIHVIRHFKCIECGKVDDYENKGKCFDCSERGLLKM
jgi:hypothetical protein